MSRLSDDVVGLLRNPESPDGMIRDALLDMGCDVAKVYVVSGTTGEYSDYRTWTVAAFLDEFAAISCKEELNRWCKENRIGRDDPRMDYDDRQKGCPLDPNFAADYTGVSYEMEAVQLRL